MSVDDVLLILRQQVDAAGGPSGWARANGVARSYVADVLAGRYKPGGKILAALNLRRVVKHTFEPT